MGLIRTLRRGATWTAIAGATGALVVTTRYLLETPQPLESKLPGAARIDHGHGGDVYYNVAGPADAPPVVLLHDFYPGASNYEYRMVFPRLAATHRAYALDWLGFGMSERPQVAYTGEFYATSLMGFLRDTIGRPAVVVAHGHAANVAVRAATDAPALFERLALVSPNPETKEEPAPRLSQAVVRAAQRAALGLVPYALLSSRPALRWMSGSSSIRPGEGASSDDSVDQRFASAHQFGGQHAILALLTGELDLPTGNALAVLEAPLLIVSGERDPRHPRAAMEDLAVLHPRAELEFIPDAGESVCEDQPEAFVRAVTRWLAAPQTRHTLDESALHGHLPSAPERRASGTTPAEPPATGASGASEDEVAPRNAEPSEAVPGTPDYVVPGVSDMGLDGPAAVTVGDITTLEPELTLGPEQAEASSSDQPAADEGDTVAMLPEAGEASAEDAAERAAREGASRPTEPASNITDVAEAAQDLAEAPRSDAALAGQGDVAGLAHTVQTPDTTVETPGSAVATPEQIASTAGEIVETPAATPADTSTKSSASGSRGQQSTRAAPREPSPRTQPRTQKQAQTPRPTRSQSAKKSSGQTSSEQGGQRGATRRSKGRSAQ